MRRRTTRRERATHVLRTSPVLALAPALVIATTISGLTSATTARAEDPPETSGALAGSHELALFAHVGFGGPYGNSGLSVEYAPIPYLALAIGGGYSFDGPQGAANVLARGTIHRGHAIALSVGASVGRYRDWRCDLFDFDCEEEADAIYSPAFFFNAALHYEIRFDAIALRPFVGYARRLTSDPSYCLLAGDLGLEDGRRASCEGVRSPAGDTGWFHTDFIMFGAAVGYAFEL